LKNLSKKKKLKEITLKIKGSFEDVLKASSKRKPKKKQKKEKLNPGNFTSTF
jgi:hypothetical protein